MSLSSDDYTAGAEIVALWRQRREARHGFFKRAEDVLTMYNGDWSVPLPEMDANERPAVANILALGVDEFSQRIASVDPNLYCDSVRPGFTAHDNRANDRRKAIIGWWEMNGVRTQRRRRSRHLIAYGTSPISISPIPNSASDKREIPFWRVRNPLRTFPAMMSDPDDMEPTDCLFLDHRPIEWLMRNYPAETTRLSKGEDNDNSAFDVLEYLDDAESVLVVVGKDRRDDPWDRPSGLRGTAPHQVLVRVANRTGMCPVVMPGRITLDRVSGMYDQMLGMYHREAKIDALNTIAITKSVFPEKWLVGHNGRAKLIRMADAKRGIIGEVENGEVEVIHTTPDINATNQAIDRLERAMRVTSSIPAEFGGESPSNVRTARRGAAVLSGSVDFPLQECQELMARSHEAEIARAVATQKAYYGKKPSMFFFDRSGIITREDYVPNDTFDTAAARVAYPMPGADMNSLIIQVGQMVGLKAMSAMTAMERLPFISDPIAERDRIEVEGLRTALLSSLEQGAVSGQVTPQVIAQIADKVTASHIPLEKAVIAVQEAMQKSQADQQNAQQNPGTPVAPEVQPGMTASPENPPVAPTPAGRPDLQSLLSQLHVPIQSGGPAGPPEARVNVGA